MVRMHEKDEPLYLYVFDGQGMHNGKVEIPNMDECRLVIKKAMNSKQTVTVTDSSDVCVFRVERGVICWPRLDQLFNGGQQKSIGDVN